MIGGPSFSHVLIALGFWGIGVGLWFAGLHGPAWQGAILAISWAWSRELAQKWRGLHKPGPPLTMDNIRQAAWPTAAALGLVALVKVLT